MEGNIEYCCTKDYKSYVVHTRLFTEEETNREIGALSDRYMLDDFTDTKLKYLETILSTSKNLI